MLVQIGYHMGMIYSAPSGLSYLWNFGSLALLSLVVQLFTGIFLAMFYTGHVDLAFDSVEHIMRDIRLGWFVRYVHANGASLFFAVVYCHILSNRTDSKIIHFNITINYIILLMLI